MFDLGLRVYSKCKFDLHQSPGSIPAQLITSACTVQSNKSRDVRYLAYMFEQHKIQDQHVITSFLPAAQVVPKGIIKE